MTTETRIANRALQRVGADIPIATEALWTEDSKNASSIRGCYQELRRAELRRNVWRFAIRVAALRPIDYDSRLITFGAYRATAKYQISDLVVGDDGDVYSSRVASNTGNTPSSAHAYWTRYFGNLLTQERVAPWCEITIYNEGHHSVGSDGLVYRSLTDWNFDNDPTTSAEWRVATRARKDDTSYYAGEIVYQGESVFMSLTSGNETDPAPDETDHWLWLTATPVLSKPNFIYPIGSGPCSQTATKNVFRLPYGFLREAPQSPKQGASLWLGAPSGLAYTDWNFEGDFLTSSTSTAIVFRFVADVSDPDFFDPMFAEGFGSRIALEICEPLTQSGAKLQAIGAEYKSFMSEARLVNGIETGATQPPEDDYITTRR